MISGCFSIAGIILAYIFPLNKIKEHLFAFSLLLCSTLIDSSLNFYVQIKYVMEEMNVVKLILGIIYIAIAVYLLIQLINPKLTFDLRMDQKEEDGQISYLRKKKYTLVIVEWSLIVLNYLILILDIISFMI